MRFRVYVEVRVDGAIGTFEWKKTFSEADSPEDARRQEMEHWHDQGYETRFIATELVKV